MDLELIAFVVKAAAFVWELPYGEWLLLSLVLLYLLYARLMRWKERYEREGSLPWYGWVAVGVMLPIGYPLNMFWNLLASLPFWDWPREPTLSQRLNRYTWDIEYDGTWRERWALRIAPLLNTHDPDHIRHR